MTGTDIVREARTLLGVRWKHQGRSREGVDCIGLPVVVRASLGLPALDVQGYSRDATDGEMLAFCRAHMQAVASPAPGDVLVQMSGTKRHMAIVGDYVHGGLSVIHAWLPARKVIETRLDEQFMKTVRGVFRFPEVAA